MEVRYLGNTNSLGFKHGVVYDIKIEKPKNYLTRKICRIKDLSDF